MVMMVVVVMMTEMMVVLMVMMVPHHAADFPAHAMVVVVMVVMHLRELDIVSRGGIGAGLIDCQQQGRGVRNRLEQIGERIGPQYI
jgi:hypothetical protein